MCAQNEAVQILAEVCRAFEGHFPHKLREAYLYGSYARGDYDAESDVDVLLTVDEAPDRLREYRRTLAAINSELSLAHDVTVSATLVPTSQFERYADVLPYYRNVRLEGVRYAQ